MNVKSSLYIKLKFLICCRVTLAYQVLWALLDHVDWMAHQDWQGREVKQVSQDPLDHQETGFVESILGSVCQHTETIEHYHRQTHLLSLPASNDRNYS